MAEHNLIRRVGGSMEPTKGFTSRRVLLPQEVELCNVLGLSEEEYWYFVDKTASYNGQRSEAYDLVPDISCDAVVTPYLINLAIGVALTVVAHLLTPKPKAPKFKTPPSLKTADASGPKRFAPQTGFDSVQELAELGDTIPLVFADRDGDTGGVRVNTKLLWSQLLSLGSGQQLKGIFLISSATLGARPDFEGYAIGDTLLENYTNGKLALYFLDGGRTGTNSGRFRRKSGAANRDQYAEGTLANESSDAIALPLLYSDEQGKYVSNTFCGTRSPNTQVEFGLYDPLPNGMRFVLPYELVLKGKDTKQGKDIDTKRNKLKNHYARFAAITKKNNSNAKGRKSVSKDDTVLYHLTSDFVDKKYATYEPWGVEDVKSSVNATRESADDSISIGEQFMVGTAVAVCTKMTNIMWEEGLNKYFTFKVTEGGSVNVKSTADAGNSYSSLAIQKCAIATISNTKSCDVTEIGLKSTVWKQITGFANVNSHPGNWEYGKNGTVKDYENENGNISLGNINKYIKRLSFFRLFVRKAGSNSSWKRLSTKPFCITGRTPQPQYNFIRISHPFGQYEFRLVPYPGNEIYRNYRNKTVNRLGGNTLTSFEVDAYNITFRGSTEFELHPNQMSNEEWFLSDLPTTAKGTVIGLSSYASGQIPTKMDWSPTGSTLQTDGKPGSRKEDWNGDDGGKGTKGLWEHDDDNESYWRVMWRGTWIGTTRSATGCIEHDGNRYCLSPSDHYGGNRKAVTKYIWTAIPVTPTKYNNVSVTNGTGGNNSLNVNVEKYTKGGKTGYKWSIASRGKNYKTGNTVKIPHANVKVTISSDSADLITPAWPKGQNLNPYDAVSDYVSFDAERTSHLDGPEHIVTYVNEQIKGTDQPYTKLAMVGVRMNSSKEWSSFSQLSAYIKKGIKVESLIHDDKRSTNLFPDIAYALLTDPVIGAGDLIGEVSVDKEAMTTAARFCRANDFYWDGVITENQNLREFIYQQASYCFLDFTIIGGRFSLVPAVPYDSEYEIKNDAKPEIKALFTDGNTKNLKVSFLSPEERQLFQARILWRKERETNGFPETRVIEARLVDEEGGSEKDPRETFDLSVFCTSQAHATSFAMFALRVRQKVDHGIKFETTPQSAMHLVPGQYFRYYSEATHTSRFSNGVITDSGVIQSQSIVTDGMSIFYWKPGDEEVKGPTDISITDGKAASKFRGCVFTVAQTNASDRVYKVESITYSEEGFVEIAGSHEPLTSTGSLATLDWTSEDFIIEAS